MYCEEGEHSVCIGDLCSYCINNVCKNCCDNHCQQCFGKNPKRCGCNSDNNDICFINDSDCDSNADNGEVCNCGEFFCTNHENEVEIVCYRCRNTKCPNCEHNFNNDSYYSTQLQTCKNGEHMFCSNEESRTDCYREKECVECEESFCKECFKNFDKCKECKNRFCGNCVLYCKICDKNYCKSCHFNECRKCSNFICTEDEDHKC